MNFIQICTLHLTAMRIFTLNTFSIVFGDKQIKVKKNNLILIKRQNLDILNITALHKKHEIMFLKKIYVYSKSKSSFGVRSFNRLTYYINSCKIHSLAKILFLKSHYKK